MAPELFAGRNAQVARQLEFLLRFFTPSTVFMEIGSSDAALSLRAAGYVERVWCVDAPGGLAHSVRPPCNLRLVRRGGVDTIADGSIDVAFSEGIKDLSGVHRALCAGGIYVFTAALVSGLRRRILEAGFSNPGLLPFMLARCRSSVRVVLRK